MTPHLGNLIGWILSKTVYRPKVRYIGSLIDTPRLFPKWATGQTWGHYIFIREGYYSEEIHVHELVHVQQWHRYGWWGFGFAVRYLWELIVRGYENNKYEKEARGE